VIQQGQSTVLTWQTSNANEITIAGLGTLPPSGSRSITPSESTTYTLVAKGPGGTKDVSARVTVNAPIAKAAPSPTDEELFSKNVKDVFFDYDKSAIRPDQTSTVENDAAFLSQHASVKVLIEGHCDDRGSEEYNIALGGSRVGSPQSASRPSATARKSHSARRTTNNAGRRTESTTSCSNTENPRRRPDCRSPLLPRSPRGIG
jgi:peptidoglycan-associated lipoprotein